MTIDNPEIPTEIKVQLLKEAMTKIAERQLQTADVIGALTNELSVHQKLLAECLTILSQAAPEALLTRRQYLLLIAESSPGSQQAFAKFLRQLLPDTE